MADNGTGESGSAPALTGAVSILGLAAAAAASTRLTDAVDPRPGEIPLPARRDLARVAADDGTPSAETAGTPPSPVQDAPPPAASLRPDQAVPRIAVPRSVRAADGSAGTFSGAGTSGLATLGALAPASRREGASASAGPALAVARASRAPSSATPSDDPAQAPSTVAADPSASLATLVGLAVGPAPYPAIPPSGTSIASVGIDTTDRVGPASDPGVPASGAATASVGIDTTDTVPQAVGPMAGEAPRGRGASTGSVGASAGASGATAPLQSVPAPAPAMSAPGATAGVPRGDEGAMDPNGAAAPVLGPMPTGASAPQSAAITGTTSAVADPAILATAAISSAAPVPSPAPVASALPISPLKGRAAAPSRSSSASSPVPRSGAASPSPSAPPALAQAPRSLAGRGPAGGDIDASRGRDKTATAGVSAPSDAAGSVSAPVTPPPDPALGTASGQVLRAMTSLVSQDLPRSTPEPGAAAPTASVPAAAQPTPDGGRELVIRLDPEHLGSVAIRVKLRGSALDVTIAVSNGDTLGALEGDRHLLTAALAAATGGGGSLSLGSSNHGASAPAANPDSTPKDGGAGFARGGSGDLPSGSPSHSDHSASGGGRGTARETRRPVGKAAETSAAEGSSNRSGDLYV